MSSISREPNWPHKIEMVMPRFENSKPVVWAFDGCAKPSEFSWTNYASPNMWRDYLQEIPPTNSVSSECETCRGAARMFRRCVKCSSIWMIWAWRAWSLPGQWPDGRRRSIVVSCTRQNAATTHAAVPHLDLSKFRQTAKDVTVTFAALKMDGIFHLSFVQKPSEKTGTHGGAAGREFVSCVQTIPATRCWW